MYKTTPRYYKPAEVERALARGAKLKGQSIDMK